MKFNAKEIDGTWWIVTHKKKGEEFGIKFENQKDAENTAKSMSVEWHLKQAASILPTITESREKTMAHREVLDLLEVCQAIEETRPNFDPEDAFGWRC